MDLKLLIHIKQHSDSFGNRPLFSPVSGSLVYHAPMKTFGFQWHLTDRCNRRCAHCYQETFTDHRELGLGELKTMADRIMGTAEQPLVSVNLTGGEPFVLNHLFDIIEYLHRFDCLDEINIITNGTYATEAIIQNIRRFPKINYLKISLESFDRERNDAIRGAGHLERVTETIRRFQRRLDNPIVMMMTLSRANLATVEESVHAARQLGLSGILFEPFVPLGAGAQMAGQVLGPEHRNEAVSRSSAPPRWTCCPRSCSGTGPCGCEPNRHRSRCSWEPLAIWGRNRWRSCRTGPCIPAVDCPFPWAISSTSRSSRSPRSCRPFPRRR